MPTRIEIHSIKKSSKYYEVIETLSKHSNSLYNQALYSLRRELRVHNKFIFYNEMDKLMKTQPEKYNNYKKLNATMSQQTLRLLDQNLKSYIKSVKDWSKNRHKYKSMPKLPNYRKSGGLAPIIVPNTSCRLKADGFVHFHKAFKGLKLKIRQKEISSIQQVRILPRSDRFVLEIIYKIPDVTVKEGGSTASIDLGLVNLVTLTFSDGDNPIIFKGSRLVSFNKLCNDKIAKYKSILDKTQKKQFTSKRLYSLYSKRRNVIDDSFHKLSSGVIKILQSKGVSTLVVGHNKLQKQNSQLKNFVQLPIFGFIRYLSYKCESVGIRLVEVSEEYTSGTSFLDDESVDKISYNKSRRIERGLFRASDGRLINADVNASYQIMKKFNDRLNITITNKIFNPITMSV